jgi:hypothetical protein
MRAFIELRDTLACLETARLRQQGRNWLHAACDLHGILLGDQGRKAVLPEMIGLFADMQAHLKKLSGDIPHYAKDIQRACNDIQAHIEMMQGGLPKATGFLARDALLNAYLNAQKKQDWLAHKLGLQQSIDVLWQNSRARTQPLHQGVKPLYEAILSLDQMFNDYVGWEKRSAIRGNGTITPERGTSYGLLVIGLSSSAVANGIIPNVSGNRLAIQLRFQQWRPGEPARAVTENQEYAMMLVPVGY